MTACREGSTPKRPCSPNNTNIITIRQFSCWSICRALELVSIRATYSMARQCVHTILSFPWKATQEQMSLSVCSFVFVFKLKFSQINKSTWDNLVDQSLGWIFVKTFLTSTQTLVKWIDDELLSVCLFQCSMWRNRVQFASSVPDTFYNQVCRSNGEFLMKHFRNFALEGIFFGRWESHRETCEITKLKSLTHPHNTVLSVSNKPALTAHRLG